MKEIRNGIPILALGRPTLGNDDAVDGRLQQTVRPVREEIGNVDYNRRQRVGLRARRCDGNGRASRAGREDLKARLGLPLEEQGDGTVIGMRAGADVDFGIVITVLGY